MAEVIPLEAVCPDCGLTWAVWLDTHDRLTRENEELRGKAERIKILEWQISALKEADKQAQAQLAEARELLTRYWMAADLTNPNDCMGHCACGCVECEAQAYLAKIEKGE
jgi:hypothetical protein